MFSGQQKHAQRYSVHSVFNINILFNINSANGDDDVADDKVDGTPYSVID